MQKIRKMLMTGGMFMLFCLVVSTSWCAPALTVNLPTYQFEPVVDGARISHTFKLKNNGDAPVTVLKVEPP